MSAETPPFPILLGDPARLFVLGLGSVGQELLAQIERCPPSSRARLRLCGVATSRRMVLDDGGVGWAEAIDRLARGRDFDLGAFERFVLGCEGERVLVDTTASDELAEPLCRLRAQGVRIVAANKHPFSGSQETFDRLVGLDGGAPATHFETTVGAGLPVLRTIQSLAACGDRVRSVEGVFSGTLSFVLHRLGENSPFSEAVREAFELGYTEPDPREDLSGQDVGRKLLILSRVAGARLEPAQVSVAPLLDDSLRRVPLKDFWDRLSAMDGPMASRLRQARDTGRTLAYFARFDGQSAKVSLEELPLDHPVAGIRGTDNMFVIVSDRYAAAPLVIRGPGAGREVTAQGVLSDLLVACPMLP